MNNPDFYGPREYPGCYDEEKFYDDPFFFASRETGADNLEEVLGWENKLKEELKYFSIKDERAD